MKSKILGLLAVGMLWSLPATAVTVSSSPCPTESTFNCITGINQLTVLGSQYDVSVVVGTFQSLFNDPSSQLASWGNGAFASAAGTAIAAALNSLSPTPTNLTTKFYDSGASESWESRLHLPIAYETFNGNPQGSFNSGCPGISSFGVVNSTCSVFLTSLTLAFAVFSPSALVPEPGTLALLGLGLAGLGFTRRRKAN